MLNILPKAIFADMPGFVIALLIVGVFAVIVVAVILVKRHTKVFKTEEKPKSEKEVAREELDRILEPIDDELVEKTEEDEEAPEAKPEEKKEEKPESEEPKA